VNDCVQALVERFLQLFVDRVAHLLKRFALSSADPSGGFQPSCARSRAFPPTGAKSSQRLVHARQLLADRILQRLCAQRKSCA
jgi:hypothetical protein